MATPKQQASRRPSLSITCVLLSVLAVSSEATILHVSKEGDGSDPSTWAGAAATIGSALVAAASGDQIWVKQGTYNEAIDMKSGVSLYGGFAGTEGDAEFDLRDWKSRVTTIDATGKDSGVIQLNLVNNVVVDGFGLTHGARGGMQCFQSSGVVRHCVIENNQSYAFGGGGISSYDSVMTIDHCAIRYNRVALSGGAGVYFAAFIDSSMVNG